MLCFFFLDESLLLILLFGKILADRPPFPATSAKRDRWFCNCLAAINAPRAPCAPFVCRVAFKNFDFVLDIPPDGDT